MSGKYVTLQVDFLNYTDHSIEIPVEEEYDAVLQKILSSLTDSQWIMVPNKEDRTMTLLQVENITKVKISDSSENVTRDEVKHEVGSY